MSDDYATVEKPPEATGLQRLRNSVLKPSRGQAVVAALLALLGFAVVTQARVTGTDDEYAGLRQSELIQALNGLNGASRRAEAEIDQLETTRDQLLNSSERRAAALKQAQKELTSLGILAGTIPAKGQGIRVTINDPKGALSINNLLDAIESLRDAGAEAMEFNDSIRVIAQTSFQDAQGGGILIDGKLLSAPYIIDVIGSPPVLSEALDFSGGFIEDVAIDDVEVEVNEVKSVSITATRAPTEPDFSRAVPNQ